MSTENAREQDDFAKYFDEAVGDNVPQTTEPEKEPAQEQSNEGQPVSETPASSSEPEQPSAAPAEPAEPTPDELKRQLEELRHKERSASGRIGAFQKRINELESQLAQGREQLLQKLNSEDNAQFREDFPEIAAAMDRKMQALYAAVEQQTMARIAPLQEVEQQRYVESQYAEVDSAFPNWRQEVATPQFSQWLYSQPQSVRQLALSTSAEDASALLTYYGMAKRPQNSVATQPNTMQDARQQRLAQAAGIPSRAKPVSSSSSIPDEFGAAFEAFVKADSRFK